jgi:hypothetical protein
MKRALIAAAAVALMTVPAMAQMSSGNSMSSNSMSSSNSMTCQQMMDKANGSMGSMTDQTKKDAMMKEMGMAKTDMAAGKESSCKMHMKKAMGMM